MDCDLTIVKYQNLPCQELIMRNTSDVNRATKHHVPKIVWIMMMVLAFAANNSYACPSLSDSGVASLSYSSDELYSAKSHKVLAGGSVDLTGCTSLPGYGFVMAAADFSLTFSGNSAGRALEFRLDSECDSILLVNDASGSWHYDDDSNGDMDAKLRLAKAADGVYDIWVGTRYSGNCNATLVIETF